MSTADMRKDYGVSQSMLYKRLEVLSSATHGNVLLVTQDENELEELQSYTQNNNIAVHISYFQPKTDVFMHPWLRDEIVGLDQKTLNLKYANTSQLADVLSLAEAAISIENMPTMQGGNFISNHQGLCIVASRDVKKLSRQDQWKAVFNCQSFLDIDFSYFGFKHNNNHIDTFMNFIDANNLAVMDIDTQSCIDAGLIAPNDTETLEINMFNKARLDNIANSLRENLKQTQVKVHRIQTKFSCILPFNHYALTTKPDSLSSMFKASENLETQEKNYIVLSPTNWILLSESLIVPQYTHKEFFDDSQKAEPTARQIHDLNQDYQKQINRLLDAAGIKKQVFSFPVSMHEAFLGGAARCLTVNYYGEL
ncbi:hypothetical protein MRY82_06545 [bacterium]|nr:hypothetical protein [bacterium]